MNFLKLLGIFNYGLILIYGLFLSIHFSGGWETKHQKRLISALCPLLLLIQIFCWLILGIDSTRQIYPLIVHLPLVLILVFCLKKRIGVSLVSVCTAYLCCQLPRWVNLALTAFFGSPLVGEISYTLVIVPFYLLLRHHFVQIANDAMSRSLKNLFLFGSLPFMYYIFDYSTVIYSNVLYAGIPALTEFFPTASIIFYVAFLVAYHAQTQKQIQVELQNSVLNIGLKQSYVQLESLQDIEIKIATHRHNMRHHLATIDALLSGGNPQQARKYIKEVQDGIDAINLKRFCENKLVNLLCSYFYGKAESEGIQLVVDAKLPEELSISDTELCSILSNGLENALHAVSKLEDSLKWIELYCSTRLDNILIEIKNPYEGEITMQDGVPVSQQKGHGYGCRSIQSVSEQNKGICIFEAEQGMFTLRVVLPLLISDTGRQDQ